MKLTDQERDTLVSLYKAKAQQTIEEARLAIVQKAWSMAMNRIYYACFHAVTALLVKDGHPVGTHLGAKMNLGKYYVKEGLLAPQLGRLFSQLASLREKADYDVLFKVEEEDVIKFYPEAKEFMANVMRLTFPTGQ